MTIQTLIDQWTLISQSGDLHLYINSQLTIPAYPIVGASNPPALVGLEVFRALGFAPPFPDQASAQAAMDHLAGLGGLAAIPGILGSTAPVPPIAITPVPVPPPIAAIPEPPIDSPPLPVDDLPGGDYADTMDALTALGEAMGHAPTPIAAAPESMIVTPIAVPIVYPTADDHIGLPHSDALGKLNDLVKALAAIDPITDNLRAAIANMAVDSISGHTAPIVTADPACREMPSIARSTKEDGFRWYLMIGPVANLTEAQAIEQQTNLLKAAKFTRTPKLDPPGDADVAGFGECWYTPISASHAERLAWMDGTQLPVHNM